MQISTIKMTNPLRKNSINILDTGGLTAGQKKFHQYTDEELPVWPILKPLAINIFAYQQSALVVHQNPVLDPAGMKKEW